MQFHMFTSYVPFYITDLGQFPAGLIDSSVARALHQCLRGYGLQFHSNLKFFSSSLSAIITVMEGVCKLNNVYSVLFLLHKQS